MKILTVENVDNLEDACKAYLKQNWPAEEWHVIYDVKSASKEEIYKELKECDVFVVQTIIQNPKQIESFIHLIDSLEKRPEVHIIHTTQNLLRDLNTAISVDAQLVLKKMLDEGLQALNVYYQLMEEQTEANQYFKKHNYYFSAVKLWHNKPMGIIFDEHPPVIYTYPEHYYKSQHKFLNALTNEEVAEFKAMLSEEYEKLLELLNAIDIGISNLSEEEEEECRKSHNFRLDILDKLNIKSYKGTIR